MSYVHGSLAESLASRIDSSRTSFKHLRDAENALAPRRNIRIGLQNQIARIEHDQRKDQQQKLAELKVQLQRNEEEDTTAEKDIEILKRKAIRETEQEKWEAIREVRIYSMRTLCIWLTIPLVFREAFNGFPGRFVYDSCFASNSSNHLPAIYGRADNRFCPRFSPACIG